MYFKLTHITQVYTKHNIITCTCLHVFTTVNASSI